MELKYFLYEEKDRYAILTVNRPDALNALNQELLEHFAKNLEEIAAKNNLLALILTGSGKSFIAGADIAYMSKMNEKLAVEFSKNGQALLQRIESLPQVVVAAINGFCLGGGLEVALACNIRYASQKALLGLPETTLGLIPGFGGTQRLSRLAGCGIAMEYIASGRKFSAEQALADGVVNRVFAPEALLPSCEDLARAICANGPHALKAAKDIVYKGLDTTLAAGLALEAGAFGTLFLEIEPQEGMNAFLEKRKAEFK